MQWINEHPVDSLKADVNKYRPEAYKSAKLKNPKIIHRVALVELLSEISFYFDSMIIIDLGK